MNRLEKILEDIEILEDPYYKDYVDRKHIEEIIRSHMDEVNNDGWIPVEERLPIEEDFLEAYCRNKYAAEFVVMIKDATRPTTLYYKNGSWFDEVRNYYNVTAWQPLPAPYKGALNSKDIPHTCDTCRRYGKSDHNCYYCRRKERPDLWETKEKAHE